MIGAEPSLQAAEGVGGPALLAYLVARGWPARPSRVSGMLILSKCPSVSEQVVEILLPVAHKFGDERRRIADALRSVAAMEGRSEASVSEDVRHLERHKSDESAARVGRRLRSKRKL